MRAGKNHQEEEEEEDEDEYEEFGGKKDTMPSTSFTKDGKCSDKSNVTRSKHSVTEQRRRSKINERYQILRRLIPDSDQRRDTASFLLEVIQYLQFLQEKVQKYEGLYQTWNAEPTKLMPWKNSNWHTHSSGHPHTMKNASGPGSTFPVVSATKHSVPVNPIEVEGPCGSMEPETEHSNNAMSIPFHLQANLPPVPILNDGAFSHMLHGPPPDVPSTDCPSSCDAVSHQDELMIEGGTISISSIYSQRLLNSLTQALQISGLDLSQANISVQISLGKQSDRSSAREMNLKDHGVSMMPGDESVGTFQEASCNEEFSRASKRQKT